MPKNLGLPETLMCKIITPNQTLLVRALIDPGSQITAIATATVTELGLRGPKRNLKIGTSGAQKIIFKDMSVVHFKLASLDEKYVTNYNIEAITMPKPTCDIGKININPKSFQHLKNITFSEPLPMTNQTSTQVHLLIGAPFTTHLFKKLIVGEIDEPAATIYKIGSCLSGTANPTEVAHTKALPKLKPPMGDMVNICNTTAEIDEEDSIEEIKHFFNLENVGIEDPSTSSQLTAQEQQAEELMEKNTYYDAINKCYYTRLLWIDNPIPYTNVKIASSAATRIVKKYSHTSKEDEWNSIQNVYQGNLKEGISQLVPSEDLLKKDKFHYICMSMVFKPDSSTTPVRPVFCANQQLGSEKTSFNKHLIEGPNYLPQLQTLMIQFRYYPTIALLDISKLYSRIRLPPEDAEYQRFFWSDTKMSLHDTQAKLKSFRHNRLIFGSRSSPFQAQFVLKKHATTHDNFYLKNYTYLDDIFVGDKNPTIVSRELMKLINILQEGDFPAQKIVSNNPQVLKDLNESQRGPTKLHKVYGQIWNLESDILTLNFKKGQPPVGNKLFTKKECLSQIMKLYDLTGIVQPYHLKAKLIFQQSCEMKIQWNEELPSPLQENFKKWIDQWHLLEKVTINRCLIPSNGKICHLACFSDSSNIGLGVNVYIISEDADGKLHSELAFCKAKVLPLKQKYTTPRSELAAAQLSARAGNYVADALQTVLGFKPKMYFFSDSTITLYRLMKKPEKYTVWVARRIQAIQKSTEVCNWKKVDTLDNPSDISSRGMDLSELMNSDLFFKGPEWLTMKNVKYKDVGEISDEEITLDTAEMKNIFKGPHMNILFTSLKEEDDVIKNILSRHNNWRKSVAIISWIRRFWKNGVIAVGLRKSIAQPGTNLTNKKMSLRNHNKSKKKIKINYDEMSLSPEEFTSTEELLFKYAQSTQFSEEIALLSKGAEIPKTSCLKTLLPIWDQNMELLRHNSRIVGYQPIILPKDHQVTKQYIHHIHVMFGHSGPSLTLYKIRKRIWVLSGRIQVKKAIFKCSCRQIIPLCEQMGKIPSWRTNTPTIWSRVGTDVLGPLYVKADKPPTGQEDQPTTIKTFAILYTCLVSRAVLVDLLYTADTAGVLRSIRKLTALYGSANIFYSDNASYYKKSSIEIKNFVAGIDWPKVRRQTAKWNGQWIFSTEAAPFRNAACERIVFSIKDTLFKVIQKSVLPFNELQVVLLEVSAYINNRSIGFLTSDSGDDMKPISPSLLVLGREIDIIGHYTGKDPSLQQLYHHRTKTIEDFLRRWTALYLQNLSPTQKWLTRNPYKIKPGMVLFIRDENRLKDLWKTGIVTKVIRSSVDNIPRTIELRTATSKRIVRPIQKLAIPEWQIAQEDDKQLSNCVVNINNISIPELITKDEIQEYLALAPVSNPCSD